MKTFKLLLIFFIIFIGCKKDNSGPIVKEIPNQMVQTNTCYSIYDTFLEALPSFQNNRALHPIFFTNNTLKDILITTETEVYLTFINENAEANNTVGWYSYNQANIPSTRPAIKNHILFPNASKVESGGKLLTGDMMQLDSVKFSAGSVIGFFLVVNGWQDGEIDYSQTLYTDYIHNNNDDQQHVFYQDTACHAIVLSWEDTPLYMDSDSDYNDIVFTVSDNNEGLESTSFDLEGIVVR